MKMSTKYPRTPHLPFSPGLQNDDRRVESGWTSIFENELVITEKMDGSNSMLDQKDVYARSHSATTRNPWDRNLWDVGGLHSQVKDYISYNEMVYLENMYGVHSIEYPDLDSYTYMFAVRDDKVWYGWDEILEMSNILRIPTVPVLERRKFKDAKDLEDTINYYMSCGSKYGPTIEGIVVRNASQFPIEDFAMNVVKYVRMGHVQTDEHWKKNWKKAVINYK